MQPISKTAVSARWVANRIANGISRRLSNKPLNPASLRSYAARQDVSPARMQRTLNSVHDWVPGANQRNLKRIHAISTESPQLEPDRLRKTLNAYVGRPMGLPPARRMHSDNLPPSYSPTGRMMTTGQSPTLGVHEYGHHVDFTKKKSGPTNFSSYPAEIRANWRGRSVVDQLQNSPAAGLINRPQYAKFTQAQLEGYRLGGLQETLELNPTTGKPNSINSASWSPVVRMRKAIDTAADVNVGRSSPLAYYAPRVGHKDSKLNRIQQKNWVATLKSRKPENQMREYGEILWPESDYMPQLLSETARSRRTEFLRRLMNKVPETIGSRANSRQGDYSKEFDWFYNRG